MKSKYLYFLFFALFIVFSCTKNQNIITISGDIPNLPDGTLYLYEDNGPNRIDSVQTKNGKFDLTYINKTGEPVYLGLDHKDKKGFLRMIGIPTHSKYEGGELDQSRFLSDSSITINSEIFDNTPKGFPEKVLSVILRKPISAGKQTEAYYNIDLDLFEKIDDKTFQIVKEKIIKYPYSYHILYEINDNKNSFSANELSSLLNAFRGEILKSNSYTKLLAYSKRMAKKQNVEIPVLENFTGKKSKIIDDKYAKHLIVFWASWCGPCRAEIPLLKKIFSKNNPKLEFVSISTDSDKNAWKKAVNSEKMPWNQFVVENNSPMLENLQIRFKFNSAIPYSVLVDNHMKVLASSTGLSSEEELIKMLNN